MFVVSEVLVNGVGLKIGPEPKTYRYKYLFHRPKVLWGFERVSSRRGKEGCSLLVCLLLDTHVKIHGDRVRNFIRVELYVELERVDRRETFRRTVTR